jgi:hypothetical protein
MKLSVLLFGLLVVSASAAPHVIDLKFENLTLRNGQKLQNGTIKSYDHANGKVVINADRQITSIQIELLPADVAERVISLVPEEVKDNARQEKADRKQQKKTSAQNSAAQTKSANDAWLKANADAGVRSEEAKKVREKESVRQQAKSLAYSRANRYFRYELKPGSGSVYITGSGIQMEEPIEVTGWDRRYRVAGTVGLEYYDTRGRSFQTLTSRFEVIVGPDSNGSVVALDISVK